MPRSPSYGLLIAFFGALVLSPDALFLRLSGMDGLQMLGWRGVSMGTVFFSAWVLTSRAHRAELGVIFSRVGAALILIQFFNALLFPLGIANAPVPVVLFGVATAPVWSALLAGLLYGEHTGRATWLTIVCVLSGIGIAVTGNGDATLNSGAVFGALCGLGVALMLALNFVTLRHNPAVPILPVIGTGAYLAGATGWVVTGPAQMADGTLWAILITGLVILPLAFFSLSYASRHTAAANVSLLLLLETVLGPLWVWVFLAEPPTMRMIVGGAIVVGSLAAYLWFGAHRRPRQAA